MRSCHEVRSAHNRDECTDDHDFADDHYDHDFSRRPLRRLPTTTKASVNTVAPAAKTVLRLVPWIPRSALLQILVLRQPLGSRPRPLQTWASQPRTVATPASSPELAYTGTGAVWVIALGLVLLAGGEVARRMLYRRRKAGHTSAT